MIHHTVKRFITGTHGQTIPYLLDCAEFALSMLIMVAFFYPSPTRDAWVGLMAGYPLIYGVRAALRQPIGLGHPAVLWGLAVMMLCVVNFSAAPYASRGVILLYRPLYGLGLMVMFIGWQMRGVPLRRQSALTGALVLLAMVAALTATTWEGKAARFAALTDALPDTRAFDVWAGGFNPNEIAGVLTWLLPWAVVMALRACHWPALAHIGLGLTGMGMGTALVLGQSLSGMVGTAAGMLLAITPRRVWGWAAMLLSLAILAGHLAILSAPAPSAALLAEWSGRPNITSLEHRGVMWERAAAMLRDHPLTGVGVALYRQLRTEYPTPGFEQALVPHPHNELLQFVTDLGWPGAAAWAVLYAAAWAALRTAWRHPDRRPHVMAAAAGLLAHAVYGLTDAIPIWDRWAFVGWWMLGLAAALSVTAKPSDAPKTPPSD